MESSVKAVRFTMDDLTQELLDKRLEKLEFAHDKVQELDFTFTREKTHNFVLEAKIHFRWGANAVIKNEDFDLRDGIVALMEKVDHKVRKEVDKKQDHK